MAKPSAKTTTDHLEIRRWAETRGGRPATVRGTAARDEAAGLLRIAFVDDEDLQPIGWDDFFDRFDEERLAFEYGEEAAGEHRPFFRLVQR